MLTLNVEVTILLKYLSNLWRFLNLPLINYEIILDLLWTKDWVLIERHNSITQATFQKNNAKLYFPVVTLYINDNIEFLENIKGGFKRKVHWNKYISKIIIQKKNKMI